jgi:two-component system, cell cycle sensor histidine kinase and response regulator CckA
MTQPARSIGGSLDLDTVLARIADGALELCRGDVAHVALRDPATDAMRFRCWKGTRYAGYEDVVIEPGRGAGGLVMRTGAPLRTAARPTDDRISGTCPAVATEGILAQCVVPITLDGRVEGLLYVGNRSSGAFTDHDEAILVRLADHAALAIRNATMFARELATRQAAETSETRYRTLIEQVPVGLYQSTPAGTFLTVNPTLVTIFGYPDARSLLATNAREVWADPADREAWRRHLEEQGAVANVVARHRRMDGSLAWARHTSHVVRDADGRIVAYEGAVEDITEQKRAEELLRDSEAQVRELQRMEAICRLAGGIAHEFNNLLTVICARSDLALERPPGDPRVKRDLRAIRATADRAARLTGQLLAFSRQQVLDPRPVDVNDVVRRLAPMLRRFIGERIALELRLADALRPVRADLAQLEQVVVNLAMNARNAMADGGRVTVKTANVDAVAGAVRGDATPVPGPCVLLAVSDTSAGISDDVRPHIFEPFFGPKDRAATTGLGLATVYGIVRQSGGHIGVSSEPGHGTTFEVYLSAIDAHPEIAPDPGGGAASAGGHETILLVEDEDDVRSITREILESHGYVVIEAAGPAEAIAVAGRAREPIDALVTDVIMPGGTGPKLAEQLVASHAQLKVVYTSGYMGHAVVNDAILDPRAVFLQKPFSPEALLRTLREALDLRADDPMTPQDGR